jgi:hypothetical protein
VDSQVDTNALEKHSVSIFRLPFPPLDSIQIPPLSSTTIAALTMETVRFSKTLVSTYGSTWHQNPEHHQHRKVGKAEPGKQDHDKMEKFV